MVNRAATRPRVHLDVPSITSSDVRPGCDRLLFIKSITRSRVDVTCLSPPAILHLHGWAFTVEWRVPVVKLGSAWPRGPTVTTIIASTGRINGDPSSKISPYDTSLPYCPLSVPYPPNLCVPERYNSLPAIAAVVNDALVFDARNALFL